MLGHMFKGVKTDGMFGGGQAESTWRDFYVEEVSDVIAKRGGIGVADIVERQLLQLQEVKS
jgi:peptidoglycan hydrolase FlgJ